MERVVQLDYLARFIQAEIRGNVSAVRVTGISLDSRQVHQDNIFVAIRGDNTDGHRYIPQAIQRGAVAVVGSERQKPLPVPYLRVQDSRMALANLSAAFYDFPARKLTVIGVTGTDGKTTTANLIFQILIAAGIHTGMISTVNAIIGDEVMDTGFHVTTPEANSIQQYLAKMVSGGITHVVLEATSHGLAQHRVMGCEFDIGVVTNITHEHLDYHGDYNSYLAAKAKLIAGLAQTLPKVDGINRLAVLNRDDAAYDSLSNSVESPVHEISYGLVSQADVRAEKILSSDDGISFVVSGEGLHDQFASKLVGTYNVYNCLAAIATTFYGLGIEIGAVKSGISDISMLPGRMEFINMGQDFTAIIDFAHTPNALKSALLSARELSKKDIEKPKAGRRRLIAIFGSAGLRDRAKRRMMAEISGELADITVLTAEDPRTESLDEILNEMKLGIEAKGGIEGQTYFSVPDRGEAIRLGVSIAHPGDIVIALGKGHEQSMCFGETEYPWDDRTAMRAALAEHLGVSGPEMPYLPTKAN